MQLLYGMVSFDLFTKKLFRLPKSLFHIMKFFYVNDSLKFYTYISSFIMTPIYAGSILFICKLSDFQTSYASNTISSIRLNKLLCFVFSWNLLIDLPSFRLATPISRTYQRLNSCNASITFVENFSSTVAFISMEFIDGEFCECMARAIIKLLYCHQLHECVAFYRKCGQTRREINERPLHIFSISRLFCQSSRLPWGCSKSAPGQRNLKGSAPFLLAGQIPSGGEILVLGNFRPKAWAKWTFL